MRSVWDKSCSVFFFLKSCHSSDNVFGMLQGWAGHRWHNTAHALCVLHTRGYKHTLIICNADFPQRQWLHERVSAVSTVHSLSCYWYADTQSAIWLHLPSHGVFISWNKLDSNYNNRLCNGCFLNILLATYIVGDIYCFRHIQGVSKRALQLWKRIEIYTEDIHNVSNCQNVAKHTECYLG